MEEIDRINEIKNETNELLRSKASKKGSVVTDSDGLPIIRPLEHESNPDIIAQINIDNLTERIQNREVNEKAFDVLLSGTAATLVF